MNIEFKEWVKPLGIGSIIYSFKPYHYEPISMEVINVDPVTKAVEVKSVSVPGYRYWITESLYNFTLRNGPDAQHYYTEQSAIDTLEQFDSNRKKEFISFYKDNPDAFIKEMVSKAYQKEADPEYGDYVIAEAIREVAKHLNINI